MKFNPIIHEDYATHIASYLCCMHYKTESAKNNSSGLARNKTETTSLERCVGKNEEPHQYKAALFSRLELSPAVFPKENATHKHVLYNRCVYCAVSK
jgi:hypothetical protein